MKKLQMVTLETEYITIHVMASWERKVKCLKIFNCKYIVERWQDLEIYRLPWLYYCSIAILVVIGRLLCMKQVQQAMEVLRKALK